MMALRVITFVIIVATANAVLWSSKLQPKPNEFAHKEGCYIKEINDVIPFKDSVNAIGYCYLIHCTEKQIDYVSCGATSLDHEYCVIHEADMNQPYPKCCPMVKCFETDMSWLPSTSERPLTPHASYNILARHN